MSSFIFRQHSIKEEIVPSPFTSEIYQELYFWNLENPRV